MKGRRRHPGRRMPFRKGSNPVSIDAVKATVRALFILVVALSAVGGLAVYSIVSRGLSAHDQPSRVEEMIARTMRRWAAPQAVRSKANPVPATDEVFAEALRHYADHCAACHGYDGRGDTEMGRGLYPKAPDMRGSTTQSLTDGELFSIIEHGVRLTGMPGWGDGTAEGERQSWALVHFVRRLPALTPFEVEQIEALTPKTADQWREEEEARRFLAGEP